jgi:radical SAM superfamily enzyme YgiQ (UPF0313 family)
MRNKVLLLYPKFHKVDFDAKSYPLGILTIGTLLEKQGYQVKLIDFLVGSNPLDILKKELDENVLCAGLSVMTPQISSALEISQLIKNFDKNIPIVWGGIHPTLFPEQVIDNPLIDFSIIINTSRGCPYQCTFCVNTALNNRKWRFQSWEKTEA